jgi:hypothetical protein
MSVSPAAIGSKAALARAAEVKCAGRISNQMTLEQLRERAFFQNTIDVWIMYCEERDWDWYNIDAYRHFISHLSSKGIKMQKFPLCIKESGGMYERGKDKVKFLDDLSKIPQEDAAAYTLKLSGDTISAIRSFAN